jgi:hypothetical protein
MCEDLKNLRRNAARVLREVKKIRRSRDLSFFEDAALNHWKHENLQHVLKHLLVGHDGQPCPAGPRPIVKPVASLRWRQSRGYAGWPMDEFRDTLAQGMVWLVDIIRVPPITIVKPSQSAEYAASLQPSTMNDPMDAQALGSESLHTQGVRL